MRSSLRAKYSAGGDCSLELPRCSFDFLRPLNYGKVALSLSTSRPLSPSPRSNDHFSASFPASPVAHCSLRRQELKKNYFSWLVTRAALSQIWADKKVTKVLQVAKRVDGRHHDGVESAWDVFSREPFITETLWEHYERGTPRKLYFWRFPLDSFPRMPSKTG